MFSRLNLVISIPKMRARCLKTGVSLRAVKNSDLKGQKGESERMKKFHDKLNSGQGPAGVSGLEDLVLVEIDPKSGESVPNHEKDPTKWGDWQHGGRVSDF